jgi:hypothetical protein
LGYSRLGAALLNLVQACGETARKGTINDEFGLRRCLEAQLPVR